MSDIQGGHAADQYNEAIRQDWRAALDCPGARRIFARMVYNAAFIQSHQNHALATAFREGVRAVYIDIMNEMEKARPGETAALLALAIQEKKHYGPLREPGHAGSPGSGPG